MLFKGRIFMPSTSVGSILSIELSTSWGLFAGLKIHQSDSIWFGFKIGPQTWLSS